MKIYRVSTNYTEGAKIAEFTPSCSMESLAGFENSSSNTSAFSKESKRRPLLTDREVECLRLISIGKTYKEVACCLTLSPRTVESYINSIKYKLNANCKSQIIEYFWKNCSSHGLEAQI